MAYVTECRKCGKRTSHTSRGCLECEAIEAKQEKVKFMDGRASLSIEERLVLIESELFELVRKPSGPVVFG